MEYVIGTDRRREILRTKGEEHSNLTGFQQFTQKYPDQTVTDHFLVVRKTHSSVDVAGNCYDWYEIDKHYRIIDKTGPIQVELDSVMASMFPNESGSTASQAYAKGKYFYHDGEFCKAKTAIPSGATFTLNTNYTVTTIAAELFSVLNS